jgi:hypothetical protein
MATYSELDELGRSPPLRDKVRAAIAVAANTIRQESSANPNHAERLAWAKAAVANLDGELNRFMPLVLAANKDLSKAQIAGAADSGIQTQVDGVVNFFAV